MAATLLACDWGTTNLRAWTLDADGQVVRSGDFEGGVAGLGRGEAAERFEAQVRPRMEAAGLPAILCGMVGSDLGWRTVPYLPCPAGLDDVAAKLFAVDSPGGPVRIVPGLRCAGITGTSDVMRGEETQLLGLMRHDPAWGRGEHLVCHPGTHPKWAVVRDGRIHRFATFMTGELFAVLRKHSVLRSDSPPVDEAAFDEGLAAAGDGGALAARLFTARARVVADGAPAATTTAYVSGLLVGAEVAAAPALMGAPPAAPVVVLGDPRLCAWYGRALVARGHAVSLNDGKTAAIRGLFDLARLGGVI